MPPETSHVRVNFGKLFPIFPLDNVVLLPHAMLRLFVFEPRYRQMTEHVLDGSGQIALAVLDGADWQDQYEQSPPVKPAVCIGQITEHHHLADGTYRIWVQGICRASIVEEHTPDGIDGGDSEILYRQASLNPLETNQLEEGDPDDLIEQRARLLELIRSEPLSELGPVRRLIEQLADQTGGLDALPTPVLLEVVALSVVGSLDEPTVMYSLLAEGDRARRATIIEHELGALSKVLTRAFQQYDPDAPSGMSWN